MRKSANNNCVDFSINLKTTKATIEWSTKQTKNVQKAKKSLEHIERKSVNTSASLKWNKNNSSTKLQQQKSDNKMF